MTHAWQSQLSPPYQGIHKIIYNKYYIFRCVEYLSEDSENNYSEAQIKELAKEQWLLNDLREICPGSLPANLKGQMKTVLNGRFVLQINAVIDIGNYTLNYSNIQLHCC